ncbi:hypothetical protein C8Q79DRAFT_925451, partial [Trametes meyenii]
DLDDVERNEENKANLRQLLIARRVSLGHHRLTAPLPPTILHLKSLERIREFFEDVWAFERVFCRCRLSDPASDRPHYDFCQLLGVDLADPWDDWANEALARTARRATPYLTQFRMLSVPFNRQGRGLHLLQCRRWWDGESPIEFLSLVDNAVIPPFSHNAWDYIPPHPFMHPPTAQISFAFYQNLHTICISTPTHVGAMSQDTIAFYRHPPEPDRNSADNYHIWLTNLPSAGDNKGGSSQSARWWGLGERGRKSLFVKCEDGLVRWQSAYVCRNLDGYCKDGVDLAPDHEVNPFTGQLLPIYIDHEYQILEERTPPLGDTNPEMSTDTYRSVVERAQRHADADVQGEA